MHNDRCVVKKYMVGRYKKEFIVMNTNPQLSVVSNNSYGNNLNLNLNITPNDIYLEQYVLSILKYKDFYSPILNNKNYDDNALFDFEKDAIKSLNSNIYSYLMNVVGIESRNEYLTIIPIYVELTDIKEIRKYKISHIL